ncbi:MAG: hypothetical protein CGW95_06700 [Phenylobacterium zucineum]|nr:MAG: hypothetical protein CGW95_06700 [Phenylobacterium zucineum]
MANTTAPSLSSGTTRGGGNRAQSAFKNRPGRRIMKEYPLTGPELVQLGGLSLAATICFSIASWCGTNWFDIYKDLSMNPTLAAQARGMWEGLLIAFRAATIAFALLGLLFVSLNGLTIRHIMKSTEHS